MFCNSVELRGHSGLVCSTDPNSPLGQSSQRLDAEGRELLRPFGCKSNLYP